MPVEDSVHAPEPLIESEALLRAITDSSRDAIVMLNPQGEISFWNPAAESILGYTREEAIGQDPLQFLVPTRFIRTYRAAFSRFLRADSGKVIGHTIDLPALHRDGREIAVELSLSAVKLQCEWHVVGTIRDVTERKHKERALFDSEEKFRQLADNIRDVFFVLDQQTLNTLYVSPGYERIWGRSRLEVYGTSTTWQDTIHPEDRERINRIAASRTEGKAIEFEYRIHTPEGVEKWIRSRSFPVHNSEGEVFRIVGLAEEFTEQKHHEQELIRAREAAEAANRAKSVFLATMSHELRTPLNAILGFAQLLEVEMVDRGFEGWRDDIKKIRKAGSHLLDLISEVIDLSKIEAGKMELHPVRVEIGPLVAEVAAAVEHVAAKNHVDISVACQPATVYGDRLRIRQCVYNLVGNACKFTQNGSVALTGTLQHGPDGDFYSLRVADTGIGISPENLTKLFSDFTQLDASTNRKYGGSGLGLAISRRLSRLMGGDIAVESKLGEGSAFTLRIPTKVTNGIDTGS